MCGVAFFIGRISEDGVERTLNEMISALHHRGPDAAGVWVDQSSRFGMAHARLSINDLSQAGAQPMISKCGRYVMSFNGEIYNHIALRKKLSTRSPSVSWRGHSDTETLLEAFSLLGVEQTLQEITGMFAIVLYDRLHESVFLIRDRLGEKPLYWGLQNGRFYCASELKSICANSHFNRKVDRESLGLYSNYGYVPSPRSIYSDLHKLPPGSYLNFKIKDIDLGREPRVISYWNIISIAKDRQNEMANRSYEDISFEIEKKLRAVVKSQLISDVPLGAFLSGGIDSSLVVAMMQQESVGSVKTFTIGSSDKGYNEAEQAREVANYIGTDHTELYISENEMLDVVTKIPDTYCEPFADSSQIPTMIVSELAKTKVSVALSGDGADEIFGGYNRYLDGYRLWQATRSLHGLLRHGGSRLIESFSPSFIDNIFAKLAVLLPGRLHVRSPGDKLHKLAATLSANSVADYYSSLVCHWGRDNLVVGDRQDFSFRDVFGDPDDFDPREAMMLVDAVTYLPDDILAKVDRASMSYSLEVRAPFLNHELIEMSMSLPLIHKISKEGGKRVLRDILYRHVPRELVERPKTGFGVPLSEWLRGPLYDWANYCLDDARIRREGFFNADVVSKAWKDHLQGKKNNSQKLWNVISFQAWVDGKSLS